ncbi:MAG: hypothetical protein K6360_09485 [Deltaproteobacteria bacterium]
MKKTFITALGLALGGMIFLVQGTGATEEEHGGTIIFTRPVKAVVFDHQSHMDMGYECDTCHDGLFEYAKGSAEETGEFNHKSFAKGQYCGACHDGSTAFTTELDKATGKCTLCHIGVKGYNRELKTEPKTPHGH